MYQIKLNQEDRQAIDWIGHRYGHGTSLKNILESLDVERNPDVDWESDIDITYQLPEYKAWQLKEVVEEDNLDCINLGSNLAQELTRFINSIV